MKSSKSFSKPKGPLSKKVGDWLQEEVGEVVDQTADAVGELISSAVGGVANSTKISDGSSPKVNQPGTAFAGQEDLEGIAKLRREISAQKNKKAAGTAGPIRDVEREMGEEREKREKKEQEERILEQVEKQRQEEENDAAKDTSLASPLAATGGKPARGSAFIAKKSKGTWESGVGKKF